MFWHVYQRACSCPEFDKVVLATDDERIASMARELNVEYVMTRKDHPSGTDRVYEAACLLGAGEDAVIVNIQGDEPALNPIMLTELVTPFLTDGNVQVATLAHTISTEEAQSPNKVKIVQAVNGDALYFSRSPIPFSRDEELTDGYLGHIGLYAFRFGVLKQFTEWDQSRLERIERLEQLRLLENNVPIRVVCTEHKTHGVDRPEDIDVILKLLRENA